MLAARVLARMVPICVESPRAQSRNATAQLGRGGGRRILGLLGTVTFVVLVGAACEPGNQTLRVGVLRKSERTFVVLLCTGDVVTGIGARSDSSAPGKQHFYWRIEADRPRELTRVVIGTAPSGYSLLRNEPPPRGSMLEVIVNPGGYSHYVRFAPQRMRVGDISWNDGELLTSSEFADNACS